jgi:hypothetical protein
MLTGKRFRLRSETIGIEQKDGKLVAVTVPAGSVVTITSGPRPNDMRLVDTVWEDKTLVMFAEDVQARGDEVNGHAFRPSQRHQATNHVS